MNLQSWHWRSLEHCQNSGLSDINYDNNIPMLEAAGYVIGSWCGSLDYAPWRRWDITTEGRKALKEYKRQVLIATVPQCATKCKGEYASECYLVTDCTTCGRVINQGKVA